MKRKSCVHWNYGYYGRIKMCMRGMECKEHCELYERRSKKNRKNHKKAGSKPVSVPRATCLHMRIEPVKGKVIRYCLEPAAGFDKTGKCPRNCPLKEKL